MFRIATSLGDVQFGDLEFHGFSDETSLGGNDIELSFGDVVEGIDAKDLAIFLVDALGRRGDDVFSLLSSHKVCELAAISMTLLFCEHVREVDPSVGSGFPGCGELKGLFIDGEGGIDFKIRIERTLPEFDVLCAGVCRGEYKKKADQSSECSDGGSLSLNGWIEVN
ncbi:hypothetical protein MK280_17970 [Myxococcota bacterium]|nr:hypothetical protein [Myxococcota bacterium]